MMTLTSGYLIVIRGGVALKWKRVAILWDRDQPPGRARPPQRRPGSARIRMDGEARTGSMVDDPPGAEPQAGHLPLPVLRLPATRDERAHADRARGRH